MRQSSRTILGILFAAAVLVVLAAGQTGLHRADPASASTPGVWNAELDADLFAAGTQLCVEVASSAQLQFDLIATDVDPADSLDFAAVGNIGVNFPAADFSATTAAIDFAPGVLDDVVGGGFVQAPSTSVGGPDLPGVESVVRDYANAPTITDASMVVGDFIMARVTLTATVADTLTTIDITKHTPKNVSWDTYMGGVFGLTVLPTGTQGMQVAIDQPCPDANLKVVKSGTPPTTMAINTPTAVNIDATISNEVANGGATVYIIGHTITTSGDADCTLSLTSPTSPHHDDLPAGGLTAGSSMPPEAETFSMQCSTLGSHDFSITNTVANLHGLNEGVPADNTDTLNFSVDVTATGDASVSGMALSGLGTTVLPQIDDAVNPGVYDFTSEIDPALKAGIEAVLSAVSVGGGGGAFSALPRVLTGDVVPLDFTSDATHNEAGADPYSPLAIDSSFSVAFVGALDIDLDATTAIFRDPGVAPVYDTPGSAGATGLWVSGGVAGECAVTGSPSVDTAGDGITTLVNGGSASTASSGITLQCLKNSFAWGLPNGSPGLNPGYIRVYIAKFVNQVAYDDTSVTDVNQANDADFVGNAEATGDLNDGSEFLFVSVDRFTPTFGSTVGPTSPPTSDLCIEGQPCSVKTELTIPDALRQPPNDPPQDIFDDPLYGGNPTASTDGQPLARAITVQPQTGTTTPADPTDDSGIFVTAGNDPTQVALSNLTDVDNGHRVGEQLDITIRSNLNGALSQCSYDLLFPMSDPAVALSVDLRTPPGILSPNGFPDLLEGEPVLTGSFVPGMSDTALPELQVHIAGNALQATLAEGPDDFWADTEKDLIDPDTFATALLSDPTVAAVMAGADGDIVTTTDNVPIWAIYAGITVIDLDWDGYIQLGAADFITPLHVVTFNAGDGGFLSVTVTGDPTAPVPGSDICTPLTTITTIYPQAIDVFTGTPDETLATCLAPGTGLGDYDMPLTLQAIREDTAGQVVMVDTAAMGGSTAVCTEDADGDGLAEPFEDGFGGAGIKIINPDSDPPNTGSSTGDAASGSTITTGELTVTLPAGTTAETATTEIDINFVSDGPGPGVSPKVEISGVSLPEGTRKTIEMPFGDQEAVCIDDQPEADIETVDVGDCASPKVEIAIPALGNPPNEVSATTPGGVDTTYTVTRISETKITIEGLVHTAIATILDTDFDTVQDVDDACPLTPGLDGRQGCPVGDEITVTLHIVNQPKSDACPDSKPSCKLPLAGVLVRVFDRNDPDFQALWGDEPNRKQYPDVFEADVGRIAQCETDVEGMCTAGEETVGDYLVIVRHIDEVNAETHQVYTGKKKSPEDFDDTGLATKELKILKIIKKDGSVKWAAGASTVINGSFLEIIYPEYTIWEDASSGFVYPFIFTSDSDWEVDICAQVPEGYVIVGAYDDEGIFVADVGCAQTFVSAETKVLAFEVVEVGSPDPVLGAILSVEHEGKVTQVDVEVPGARVYVESDMQASPEDAPADAKPGSGGGSQVVWWLVAAALVPVIVLTGFTVWRHQHPRHR